MRIQGFLCATLLSSLACASSSVLASAPATDAIPYGLRQALFAPVQKWIGELGSELNEQGLTFKRGSFSKLPRKVDDQTYQVTMHVDTAGADSMTTERFLLTLKNNGRAWEIADRKVQDTYVGLHRVSSGRCFPFESFSFDREGMTAKARNGTVCVSYYTGKVDNFAIQASEMSYQYAPPEHAMRVSTGHDFYELHRMLSKEHAREFVFDPAGFFVSCDPTTCNELLESSFTGLDLSSLREGSAEAAGSAAGSDWVAKMTNFFAKERKEDYFAHFRPQPEPENRNYSIFVARDLNPQRVFGQFVPGSGVVLAYDNWEGWEVTFSVVPQRYDIPGQVVGPLYGYFSEETLKNSDPYELERRDDGDSRLHEVFSVKGTVEAALEDPEILQADIEFGITIKEARKELPFAIASIPRQGAGGTDKPRQLFVNSIQLDGQELTWVRTGAISGRVILPEVMPPGTKLNLRMNFATRAIYKVNHAYSAMARFGWMPFVRFGDFIDEFELTVKTPAQYTVLGIGQKVSERREGDVLITRWKSDSPVVFPTIIFGKYTSKKPGFEAKKADGTVIPVEVHVDEVSMGIMDLADGKVSDLESFNENMGALDDLGSGARGIREKGLVKVAEEAANAINLYTDISGIDYPYGELNLVNDPAPALYGQAPSSLIYLGSFVFRGEGTMAGDSLIGGGGTRTAKFLKSVVAHEVGHQWWGSRVSNSNFRNYWFVETLAEYFSAIFLEAVYGQKEYEQQLDEWRGNILNSEMKVSVQNANTLWTGEDDFRSYQSAVYSKGPYAFHMLREIFKGEGPPGPKGADKKFFDFLKKFSQELAAKREIVTLDIQTAAEKALGGVDAEGNPYNVDLSWFFDQWIRGTGIPEYRMVYDVRQTEDGGWLIEGTIQQRIVIGSSRTKQVLKDRYYRGVVDLTVTAGGQEYKARRTVEGAETPFKLKVPQRPVEIALNKYGETLAHDVLLNKSWD